MLEQRQGVLSGGTMLVQMLWLRGLLFTVLVPGAIGFVVPLAVDPLAHRRGGVLDAGALLIGVGTLIYALCLIRFLAAGGTPAIFFARHLRFLIGEEPAGLVSTGLYRYSRNPMYVGVLLVVFGQAIFFASLLLSIYAFAVLIFFYLIVVFVEEPHLRATRGGSYARYCRAVPRWLGVPSPLKTEIRGSTR